MVSAKSRMQRETDKILDLVLGNNRKFDCQVSLLRRRISNYSLKWHTEIINGKWEDNDFVMNSMRKQVVYVWDHMIIIAP